MAKKRTIPDPEEIVIDLSRVKTQKGFREEMAKHFPKCKRAVSSPDAFWSALSYWMLVRADNPCLLRFVGWAAFERRFPALADSLRETMRVVQKETGPRFFSFDFDEPPERELEIRTRSQRFYFSPKSDITFDALVRNLRSSLRGTGARLQTEGENQVCIRFDGWEMYLRYDDNSRTVAQQARREEFLNEYQSYLDEIRHCRKLVEVWSTSPEVRDSERARYGEVIEVVRTAFAGVYEMEEDDTFPD
jgi:hypothetical protein